MFRRTRTSSAVLTLLASLAAMTATAQDVQRIEITGSAIKRISAEGALPVTVINVEELSRQGVTTVEQAMARIASNQSNFGSSASIGGTTGGKAEADLRGLSGPTNTNANKTLVLLNGRRLANHAFDAAAVDLNAIPLAAIDRIEVLRDGASSIYGSDAIGGVINFITRRNLEGVEISAQASKPQAKGGGDTQRFNLAAGFGSLSTNGFNLLGTLDWRKQNVVTALERPFSKTGVVGGDITAGTSGTSFPGDVGGFEPSLPNCAPPLSIPDETGETCRYDFVGAIDIIPQNEQLTGLLKGTLALGKEHTFSLEYLRANNKQTSRVAAAPTTSSILQTSPFWPTGATVQLDPTTGTPRDFDPNTPGVQPGSAVNWRQVPAGQRTSGDDTTSQRALAELQGVFDTWDYRVSAGLASNKSEASVERGYVNDSLIRAGVLAGRINPLGDQTAAGLSAIEAAQVVAPTQIGTNKVNFVDFKVSGELFQMSGGVASLALGAELRREKSFFEALPITAELGSLGIDPDSDTSGSRKIAASYAELSLPLSKGLDLTLAARYDKYSDVGNTFNPKISLRYQPTANLVLRGSTNSGFRAPTLYEIYQPQALTFTTDNYDDPLLCPGGTPTIPGTAGVVCGQQVLIRGVGPVGNGQSAGSLEPEKSRAFTLGAVLQVTPNTTIGVDVWGIKIKNLISGLPEQEIFGNPAYRSRFLRCSQLPAGPLNNALDRTDADVCTNFPSFDPIAYIDSPVENLGGLKTNGFDVSANWRSGPMPYGSVSVGYDMTYLTSYKYQRERGGAFINAVGRYSDNAPVFRMQHALAATWTQGSWSTTLANRYKSGYLDQDGINKVSGYSVFDVSVSWTGVKNLTLRAGVTNLLDKDPPVSVQTTTFQRGYDPRFTDPIGRAYTLGVNYKFF